MSQSARLRAADVRAVFLLAGECRDLGDDPAVWRRHYGRRLGELVGAEVVHVGETAVGPPAAGRRAFRPLGVAACGWEDGFNPAVLDEMIAEFVRLGPGFTPVYYPYLAVFDRDDGATGGRADLVPPGEWERSGYGDLHRQAGLGDYLINFRSLAARPGTVCDLAVARAADGGTFTTRQRAVVREAQALVGPLVGGPLSSYLDPAPSALPPRARQVLRCLLEGDTDKQTAARLGVSLHTVNQYAKVIFRHFGVASRPELLARWLRRGWRAGFAWVDDEA